LFDGKGGRTNHSDFISADEEHFVASFITTIKSTEQGLEGIRMSPKRTKGLTSAAKKKIGVKAISAMAGDWEVCAKDCSAQAHVNADQTTPKQRPVT
jgi:uncharacterized protein with GYD domain